MNKDFVNKVVAADIAFHCGLILLILSHPDYFKKELVGWDLVLHLTVLALLFKVNYM